MTRSGLKHIILGMGLLLSTSLWAQEWIAGDNVTLGVSSYASMDTNHAPVNLTLTTLTPGTIAQEASNSDVFVRVSSITPGGTNREITAKIFSGSIPAGTTLTLVSAPSTTANSGGDLGTAITTPITLSFIDQILVYGISSCYTGAGYNDGYQLTFNWSLLNPEINYSQLEAATYNITVVFTITAHDGN